MAKKSFLLVSLKEKKAKKLAEVISNNTCRKILDYLAERKDSTETEIAKELKAPISTIHYNMKALLDAKLVKSDEYHYSPKGKEVNHYSLANRYVIIAPEGEKSVIRDKLKSIIPTILVVGIFGVLISFFQEIFSSTGINKAMLASDAIPAAQMSEPMTYGMNEVLEEATRDVGTDVVRRVADDSVNSATQEVVRETSNQAAKIVTESIQSASAPSADGMVNYGADTIARESMNAGVNEIANEGVQEVIVESGQKATELVVEKTSEHSPEIISRCPEVVNNCSNWVGNHAEIIVYVLVGAVLGIGVYLLVDWIRKR